MSQLGASILGIKTKHECDSRRLRIERLAEKYHRGQDLYIISASLRGVLRVNPWTSRRKRGAGRETFRYNLLPGHSARGDDLTEALVPHSEIDLAALLTQADACTPFWDQTVAPERTRSRDEFVALPVIGLHNHGPRSPATLTAKVSPAPVGLFRVICPSYQRAQTIEPNGSTEDNSPSLHIVRTKVSPTGLADNSSAQEFAFASLAIVTGDILREEQLSDVDHAEPGHEGHPCRLTSRTFCDPHPSTVSGVSMAGETNLLKKGKLNEVDLGVSPVHIHTAKVTVFDQSLDPQITRYDSHQGELLKPPSEVSSLDTQAELVRARVDLADACGFLASQTLPKSEKSLCSSPLGNAAALPHDNDCLRMSLEDDDSAPGAVTPAMSEKVRSTTIRENSHGSLNKVAISTSPISNHILEEQFSFTNFRSADNSDHQTGSLGSPLTFSPNIAYGQNKSQGQEDITIDDIQQYLHKSNWSAEEEAQRLMNHEYRQAI